MSARPESVAQAPDRPLGEGYREVRAATESLCANLAPEDCVIQTMPDVSPTRWHLAHVTWFFEHFVLTPHKQGYQVFNEQFGYLFNSYYYTVGEMHLRPERGFLSRPTVAEVMAYRRHVDEQLLQLLNDSQDDELTELVTLGLHHEQQHQELILTDIKHVFSHNPLYPALRDIKPPTAAKPVATEWLQRREGIVETGFAGKGFCFDNETPRHRSYQHAHAIASRPVNNAEYLEFINDGGYQQADLWLSDGWATVNREAWNRPLYWTEDLSRHYTLGGMRELDLAAPVCHVSYYEADAYARWAGARLPTETEWETLAATQEITGNFQESGQLHPCAPRGPGLQQLFGDVWEWTQSAYSPYPGYRPLPGSLGEYNGKFMCNQLVLRGGSCATPQSHIRASYRNFFYPHSRWQFSGIRLAKD